MPVWTVNPGNRSPTSEVADGDRADALVIAVAELPAECRALARARWEPSLAVTYPLEHRIRSEGYRPEPWAISARRTGVTRPASIPKAGVPGACATWLPH